MALYKLPQEKYEQLQIILTEISVDEISEVLDYIFLKNKELIKKYYVEQYTGKWIFPPIRRYGVEDAEKDTQKFLEVYGVLNASNLYEAIDNEYDGAAVLLEEQDVVNFNFLCNSLNKLKTIKDLLIVGYYNVYLDKSEIEDIETLTEIYDSGEIQEVISYYKKES